MEIQLPDVLTITGAAGAAGLVTGLVQVLKTVLPIIKARGWEQSVALLLSMILVTLAFVDQAHYTLDSAFVAFVAWLMIAKLSMGIYDEITRAPGAMTEDVSGSSHVSDGETIPASG